MWCFPAETQVTGEERNERYALFKDCPSLRVMVRYWKDGFTFTRAKKKQKKTSAKKEKKKSIAKEEQTTPRRSTPLKGTYAITNSELMGVSLVWCGSTGARKSAVKVAESAEDRFLATLQAILDAELQELNPKRKDAWLHSAGNNTALFASLCLSTLCTPSRVAVEEVFASFMKDVEENVVSMIVVSDEDAVERTKQRKSEKNKDRSKKNVVELSDKLAAVEETVQRCVALCTYLCPAVRTLSVCDDATGCSESWRLGERLRNPRKPHLSAR